MDTTPDLPPKNTDKPKWLRRLERESWQAELIVSGAAILGTLQLPGLLKQFQYYLLENYEQFALYAWQTPIIYWGLFVYGLLMVFVFHFIVRSLWIGLVGLNSVYPDGFAPNERMSKDFLDKTRAAYGDVDGFILQLDRLASGIFGVGFAFAGVTLNLGLLISFALLVAGWLESTGVERSTAYWTAFVPLIILFTMSLLSSLLSVSAIREKAWVKRVHFPMTRVMGRFVYPVNARYIMTGINLITTQAAAKQKRASFYLKYVGITLLITFVFTVIIIGTVTIRPGFDRDQYHRMGDYPAGGGDSHYADAGYDRYVYKPLVSSRYPATDGPLWAWVPMPEREYVVMMDNCQLPAVSDSLPRAEKRHARQQRYVACAREYVDFYLDDRQIPTPQPLVQNRRNKDYDQGGLRFELTDQMPAPGQHVLRIVTHFPLEEGDTTNYRTTYLNFWVVE